MTKNSEHNLTEKDVAIIIPLSFNENLSESEQISLNHLNTYLKRYDRYYVVPERFQFSEIDIEDFNVQKFPDKFFGSAQAHNKLLASVPFYETFADYKYIMIYHLDALVFSDQLLEWCERDYDYIAPPWMASEVHWLEESCVGNGGFSIRKVDSFIKLYSSQALWETPGYLAKRAVQRVKPVSKLVYPLAKWLFKMKRFNNVNLHFKHYISHIGGGEDRFIALHAKNYRPDFKISPVDVALQFAFEINPKKCYEMNNKKLPFGCHAYDRYDLSFWEPYLIKSPRQ